MRVIDEPYIADNQMPGVLHGWRHFAMIEAACGWLAEHGGGSVRSRQGRAVVAVVPRSLCTREWPPSRPNRTRP